MIPGTREIDGRFELTEDLSASPLYNHDLAPTTIEKRTWNVWHIAALWIGMAVCIPTYMLAAGLMSLGMNWWQAVLTVTLGNLIVFVPMALNGHAGAKYGIPFPVFIRAPFGTRGSNVPALLRAVVACGWFGIQTWIGGKALYVLAGVLVPSILKAERLGFIGINGWQLLFFFVFWAVNLYFILAGTESIKWLESYSAPVLIAIGVALLVWGAVKGGGVGRVLDHSENFTRPTAQAWREDGGVWTASGGVEIDGKLRTKIAEARVGSESVEFRFRDEEGHSATLTVPIQNSRPADKPWWIIFFPALTAMVGYWATLSLNIPDFTRFAKSQRDQALGQLIGLPTTMALYAFIGVAVTSASLVIFKDILITEQAPWDPVALLSRFTNPLVVILSMFFLMIATLTTNIAANVVSPANDFSNAMPKRISYKTGGIITAVIGILMMPWKLAENPKTYIFSWLIGYGALLGPIAGIMIADYYVVRRTRLELPELYKRDGQFRGFNVASIVILLLAILPNLPGFLASVNVVHDLPKFWAGLFDYAWFVGFAIAFGLYSIWKPTRTSSPVAG